MEILTPDYILFSDRIESNLSIAFDKTIQKIAPLEQLIEEFPNTTVTKLHKNSLVMPGLINPHVHLEFSANKTNLRYGDFISWLYSVIENREELINNCNNECMKKAVDSMLESGITTFGAVSSYCMDLEVCADAKQNVIFFNELIGSQASVADTLFNDFVSRLNASKAVKRDGFHPAIAIHSPYSVHPILVKKALKIAKNENLNVTAHFMESKAERDWLDSNNGDFKDFFQRLLQQNSAVSKPDEFLSYFDDKSTLFTHATKINDDEIDSISKSNHAIIHCPISNRLLGNGVLDIEKLEKNNIKWLLATDGLSSNYKLDLFEEMKIALFMHSEFDLQDLAKKLIRSVTKDAADILGLNTGEIKQGKNADMLVVNLEDEPSEELAVHLILQRYNISKIYINGKLVKEN